ncbi:unnamed protein product [Ilex paraguariensis]|uniref:BHLH domain-containing protein n=1 Tax=Ilex paraguariensis TaxID=185542 RepID=A0ABC8S2L7_9AQUA
MYSILSSFTKWSTTPPDHHRHPKVPVKAFSQCLLKYVLFSVPYLHTKHQEELSPKSRDIIADSASRFRKGTPQEELSANHVLAERRRREKLNERFIILRSLVPFVTKMDKASILGDTIEYVKQLRKKIQDLEAKTHQMEIDQRSRMVGPQKSKGSLREQRSGVTVVDRAMVVPGSDKRKMRIVEGSGGAKSKVVDSLTQTVVAGEAVQVEVSIIERDALVELQCPYREGLLLDVMQSMRELRVEIVTVQSSLNNGVFVAELRAKVKENINGKKATIMEVKRAIHQIIPQN